MIVRKKRIKKAKYNGAYFYVDANETSGGRRIVSHEFPYAESPSTEDLGRRQRQWDIVGFIAGPLYKQDLKKLQDALEKEGIGTLDHPYLGLNKKVRCPSYRITEVNREFGFVHFQMTFCEAGDTPQFTVQSLADQADLNQSLLGKTLDVLSSASGSVSGYLTDAADRVDAFSERIEDQMAPFVAMRDSLGAVTASLAQLREISRDISSEPKALFYSALNVCQLILDSPLSLLSILGIIEPSLDPLFLAFYAAGSEDSAVLPTELISYAPGQESRRTMSEIVCESLAAGALIKMSGPILKRYPAKKGDREKCKTIFLNRCDEFLGKTQDMVLIDVIQNLKSQTFSSIQQQEEQRKMRTDQTKTDTNILLLSYELFGDVKFEPQILSLNDVQNPALIPRNTELEIACQEMK